MKDSVLEPVADKSACKRRITRGVIYFVGLFLLTACAPGSCVALDCDPNNSPPVPLPTVGLSFESAQGDWPLRETTAGETFTVPVAVWTQGEDVPGTEVVVTATTDGATLNTATRTVTLAPRAQATYTTFEAVVSDTPPARVRVEVSRGGTPISRDLTNVPNLVSLTLTPAQHDIPRGQSRNFTIGVLPRGNTEGTVSLDLIHTAPVIGHIVLAPTPVIVDLTRGSTVPVERTIAAVVSDQAPLDIFEVRARQGTQTRATARIQVVAATGGEPTFTFAANPTTLSAPVYQETVPVTFTLTPVNGFSGDVVVSQTSDGEIGINPTIDDETFTVAPGTPVTFTRRFTRYYGGNTIHVTYTATHQQSSTTREVVINLNP